MSESLFITPPAPEECDEFYHRYTSLVLEGDLLETLRSQHRSALSLFENLPESKHEYRYKPGKWTMWEVLRHVVDTEWIMAFRALHFVRSGEGAIPGMEQDEFMAAVSPVDRSMRLLLEEYRHLRAAATNLFCSFDEEALRRRGTASGCSFTVRSLLYIIAGHERHHMNVVKKLYL